MGQQFTYSTVQHRSSKEEELEEEEEYIKNRSIIPPVKN
jgi:hypothetical protein